MQTLTVMETEGRGLGLFTKVARRPDEEIFVVEGTLHTGVYDDDFGLGPTWFGAGPGRWIEPADGNPGRLLNHSCEPNARIVDLVRVVAGRDIKAGEEVTIDYALTEEDPFWSMDCRCNARGCRGTIKASMRFGAAK